VYSSCIKFGFALNDNKGHVDLRDWIDLGDSILGQLQLHVMDRIVCPEGYKWSLDLSMIT
jgi:hypothetical protein